ncbi:MAG: beta-propeller fold lactonase family protein [Candidatus Angelobacter sp.]
MKNFVFGGSVFVLAMLLLLFSLSGCGSVSSGATLTPTPTPPGATPTPTPVPAAHGTFIFVNGGFSSTSPTDGYRLNADGTLTLISGSPFPITGLLAASSGFLMVSDASALSSYAVDPATGVPAKVSSGTVASADAIAADAKNVYVGGFSSDNKNSVIYGFSVGAKGTLAPLPGSPYPFAPVCVFCDQPVSLAVNDNFLAVGGVGFHSVGDFTVYPRAASGVLGKPQGLGTEEQGAVTIQHPTGNVAFAIDGSIGSVSSYLIDSTGKPAAKNNLFSGASSFVDEKIDATGKYVLVLDQSGVVHVLTIDSATAAFSQIGTSEAAGNGAGLIAIDPTGRFVIVAQSSNNATPAPPDRITVFTFDPATGAMKKLQSYPVGKAPFRITIVAE